MRKNHEPFSVVLSGGCMRCAWSGGFLVAMKDLGLEPSLIIAKSGNAGNVVYLATNQAESIKRIWTNHLIGRKFINFLRFWKIMDIDYLIDDVFTKKEPINFPELKSSEMKVFIACFNATKHTIDYFSNDVIDLSVLKATKSMPIVYGKSTLIDGNTYVDRPFSPYQMLEDQKENIVGKVILIDTRDSGTFIQTVCHLIGDKTYIQENSSERVFVIKPTTMSANLLSHSEKVMKKTYTEGYEYALSIKEEMEEFLDK